MGAKAVPVAQQAASVRDSIEHMENATEALGDVCIVLFGKGGGTRLVRLVYVPPSHGMLFCR